MNPIDISIMGIINLTPDSFYDGGKWENQNQNYETDSNVAYEQYANDWQDFGNEWGANFYTKKNCNLVKKLENWL